MMVQASRVAANPSLFQKTEDVSPAEKDQVDSEISALVDGINSLKLKEERTVSYPLQRQVSTQAVGPFLDTMQKALEFICTQVSSQCEALAEAGEKIPNMLDGSQIVFSIDRYQQAFIQYKLLLERCTNIRRCVDHIAFEKTLELVQTITTTCTVIETTSELNTQISKIEQAWQRHWPNGQSAPERNSSSFYVQHQVGLLECQALVRFAQSIHTICKKIPVTDIRAAKVQALNQQVYDLLVKKHEGLQVLWSDIDQTSTAADASSVSNPLSSSLLSSLPATSKTLETLLTFTPSQYVRFASWRIDKETFSVTKALSDIALQVSALSSKLHEELCLSLQTNPPTGPSGPSSSSEYKRRIFSLQEAIRVVLIGNSGDATSALSLRQTKPSVLTSPLLQYASTLQDALVGLRQILIMREQLRNAHFEQGAKIRCSTFFTSLAKSSEIGFETLKMFSMALLRLEHLKQIKPQPGIVGECLQQGVSMLCETFANRASIVTLTPDETAVFELVMARRPFASFSGPKDGTTNVPETLAKSFVKQITHFLFFQKNPYDVRLQLLFHVLFSHPDYSENWKQHLAKDQDFWEIAGAYYHRTHSVLLEAELLSPASEILQHLYTELLLNKCSPVVYARCWQLYFELIQKDTAHGDTFAKLKEFLHNILVETGQRFSFHLLSSQVKAMTWHEASGAQNSKDVLIRALYAALWASDSCEKEAANIRVNQCLQDPSLRPLLQEGELLELVYTKTIRQIIEYKFDTTVAVELELLRQGPIKTYLEQKTLANTNLIFGLYFLLKHEESQDPEHQLTRKLFEKTDNGDALKHFLADCDRFRTFGSQ